MKHWSVTSNVSDGEVVFRLTRRVEILPPGGNAIYIRTETYGHWLYDPVPSFVDMQFPAVPPSTLAAFFGDTTEKRVLAARNKAQRLADKLNRDMDEIAKANQQLSDLQDELLTPRQHDEHCKGQGQYKVVRNSITYKKRVPETIPPSQRTIPVLVPKNSKVSAMTTPNDAWVRGMLTDIEGGNFHDRVKNNSEAVRLIHGALQGLLHLREVVRQLENTDEAQQAGDTS